MERFLNKIEPMMDDRGCWEWTGALSKTGYGHLSIEGKTVSAHRYSYILFCGVIPDNYFVMHQCDNRSCVNPGHLTVGTRQDNADDMCLKGRSKGGSNPKNLAASSKVTIEQVFYIRREHQNRRKSTSMLARELGLRPALIGRIIRRDTWKHVP